MKELVEYIAQAIASKPDEVQVDEEWEGERVFVRLTGCAGRQG